MKIPKNTKHAVVTTVWGETNINAIFSEGTGMFYFRLDSGRWLNYEPYSVANAVVLTKLEHLFRRLKHPFRAIQRRYRKE